MLLSRREVAGILGVTTTTIYRWDREGVLEGQRIGGVVRYRREDVERLAGGPIDRRRNDEAPGLAGGSESAAMERRDAGFYPASPT
jgi:excisionase family DNA binding protein